MEMSLGEIDAHEEWLLEQRRAEARALKTKKPVEE